ncbi:MAG: putative metal-binding motif-containing protein [Deltaproteobacteria bacterium]|nr:putative metal-binding motif-containing protein [Deltaproteobacteria bacterium]
MRLLLLGLALAADSADIATAYDEDGDRFSVADGDCNDADARVYPGHAEDCDGLDNDCNLQVDEGCPEAPEGEGCDCGASAGLVPALLLGAAINRRRASSATRRSGTSPS